MRAKNLQTQETELHTRINAVPHDQSLRPIPDGVINIDAYVNSNKRVMIVLKEAHDSGKERGGWLYRELFDDKNIDRVINGSRSTFHPLIYTLYGIRNTKVVWNDMPDVRDDEMLKHLLRTVAIINLKKIPGKTRSTWNDIKKNYLINWKDIVKDQIETYNPEVILFGGTFSFIANDLEITRAEMTEAGSCEYISKNGRILIDAYHPGQTKVKQEAYVNDILKVVRNTK